MFSKAVHGLVHALAVWARRWAAGRRSLWETLWAAPEPTDEHEEGGEPMNTTNNQLAELLTGSEETDNQIRRAFELGLRRGRILDRESVKRNAQIQTTRQLLNSLMATQNIDLQTAMKVLRIPNAERKTFVKLFGEKRKTRSSAR